MQKHLQNLERVCQKLQFRYGDNDELVIEFKHELESLKTKKSLNRSRTLRNQGEQNAKLAAPLH
ncbi:MULTISPECIES: hypothetical protein [unclassified Polaromonas]|uniref:hypothetical protein n=1 Tax=unclassified Polaromonas TaxID=2638319 RepID=UPI0018CB5C4C|nr:MULTISPECIES: hypothetical protein [unclassified Polaromonas]MBG6072866.1 hypothetical protein [Polaromonas sp. CG_9.7]MBG6114984.1 hypothetical protein [Polaromonas sp. CG_9.2]MDH6183706.1 hypothetical protein [Polaromonas sp. CG_23.6]